MAEKYWEDFKTGDKFVTAGKTITETAVTLAIGLAGLTEPMFVDAEYAGKSQFKGLMVPGPLTMLVMLGLWQQLGLFGNNGLGFLGFDKVRFLLPLRPGDTITVELEVIDSRETSKSDAGLIKWRWDCRNQRSEVVVQKESANLVRRKNG